MAGHYEVPVAVAEKVLLLALSDAPEVSIHLVVGYSCRTQASDLMNVQGVTLAQLLTGVGAEGGYTARATKLPDLPKIAETARVAEVAGV